MCSSERKNSKWRKKIQNLAKLCEINKITPNQILANQRKKTIAKIEKIFFTIFSSLFPSGLSFWSVFSDFEVDLFVLVLEIVFDGWSFCCSFIRFGWTNLTVVFCAGFFAFELLLFTVPLFLPFFLPLAALANNLKLEPAILKINCVI